MQASLALDWMNQNGRTIDQRCVSVELGEADARAAAEALGAYRNPDGGFGHALEPDVRLDGSSVLATTIALQLLATYPTDSATELLEGASRFLVDAYDADTAAWPIVPADVSDAPHAPWWDYRPSKRCLVNPRAEVLGYAYRWPDLAAGVDLDRIADEVAEHIKTTDSVEMHELQVFNRLFATPSLPQVLESLRDRFLDLARQTIPVDPARWKRYSLQPMTIVDRPSHPLAGELAGAIERNIHHLQSLQTADGSWDPPWDWAGLHPEAWPNAEKDIRSVITARAIGTLQRFNALR